MSKSRIWAVVAARSGSKGFPGKNIRLLAGKPLIAHAINFSNESGIFEKVLLSTDSEEYADIGKRYGAWIPFLRGANAAQDSSMEEHILEDIDMKLRLNNTTPPDIIVWLRPTFPFRSIEDLKLGLSKLEDSIDSVRLVTEGEPRLYEIRNDYLVPRFDDRGCSMIRRQEFPATYKVFHTDIFWYRNVAKGKKFLGDRVRAVPIHKICAMDVDGIEDFQMIEALMASNYPLIRKYSH
ncbi:MAG: acylneuraminate cytidylyltransferase family protein [Thiothrix sp.]|uniref:acylneuraminate cytidylyltransferase family protein n=1 Tax=Thiothrix sp. TaxID=1032 RepID=UPI002619BE78|nr:acylneuraminate cytidylyltransferase family protein [Thiothrix sp.]MDD5392919.1 acylneuraminate cytidylyltransferase family protein [Thiothrix sp.]